MRNRAVGAPPKPTSVASCSNALATFVRTTLATLTGQIVVNITKITMLPRRTPMTRSLRGIHVDRWASAVQHDQIESEPDLHSGIGDALGPARDPGGEQGHRREQQE